MKITGFVQAEAVTDVRCDVCEESTRLPDGSLQFGTLQSLWGYGTLHDGERYEVHLCEQCFFTTLSYLKQERRTAHMFEEDLQVSDKQFGLVRKNDFFRDEN